MRRLFHHYESLPGAPLHTAFLIARVLEDGDTRDLERLFAAVGEAAVRDWLVTRGGRQLSRRSRLFWGALLGIEPAAAHPASTEIWPL